jgi:hypothetical protein
MIEICPESDGATLAVVASDKLTADDYELVFMPALEERIERFGRARAVIAFDDDFRGWELGALWDDAKFGLKHRNDFERIAVVGAPRWVEWSAKVGELFMHGEVKSFEPTEYVDAVLWAKS